MLITEWNQEEAIAVAREEAYEDGIEIGFEKGVGIGREEAREETREEDRKYFLELLHQGLPVSEIIQRLENA